MHNDYTAFTTTYFITLYGLVASATSLFRAPLSRPASPHGDTSPLQRVSLGRPCRRSELPESGFVDLAEETDKVPFAT
jgi:hypothetical protein